MLLQTYHVWYLQLDDTIGMAVNHHVGCIDATPKETQKEVTLKIITRQDVGKFADVYAFSC